MSEKIYALLFRFFPSAFRERYGDEVMQLLRDRLRNERGLVARCRLWLDLIFDATASLASEYFHSSPPLVSAPTASPQGVPSFRQLEEHPPRAGSFLFGTFAAFAALFVFTVLFRQAVNVPPLRITGGNSTQPAHVQPSSLQDAVPQSSVNLAGAARSNVVGGGLPASSKQLDATAAMIQLFRHHNIVMFGEVDGSKQEYEFLTKLISSPEFSDNADDIVIEFGNALYQPIVDRYIAGEDVPYSEVEKAWRNNIGAAGPVSPIYASFYKTVREANLHRHGGRPLHLLMGSPAMDWSEIHSSADLTRYQASREQWYVQVVKNKVLARNHHALLIMGASHFLRGEDQAVQDELLARQHRFVPPVGRSPLGPGYIERELRASGANPYIVVFGTNAVDSRGGVDPRFDAWHAPILLPTQNYWVGFLPTQPVITGGHAVPTPLTLANQADAVLYVAPCSALQLTNESRAEFESAGNSEEIERRTSLQLGRAREIRFSYGDTPQCVSPALPQPGH